jgi:hypothetical protein
MVAPACRYLLQGIVVASFISSERAPGETPDLGFQEQTMEMCNVVLPLGGIVLEQMLVEGF